MLRTAGGTHRPGHPFSGFVAGSQAPKPYEVAAAARVAADSAATAEREARDHEEWAVTATGTAQGIQPAATRKLAAAAMIATSDKVESSRAICESE